MRGRPRPADPITTTRSRCHPPSGRRRSARWSAPISRRRTARTPGKACRTPSRPWAAALEGAGGRGPLDLTQAHAAVRPRVRAGEPLLWPGLNNKYDATIGTSLGKTVGSEDCLYLNIWRPASAAAQLPVIVWVHGGSNISGYTADPMYDGANLARTANAVVVSVNYRLGVLGFFNLGATEDRRSARRLRQLRPARHHQGAAVRQSQHRRVRRRCGQRHADGRVGRGRERLRCDDVAAARRCQSGDGAQTAADQRRHFAGEELPAGSVATLAPPAAFRGQADLLLRS